jgi:hypothetical protein
MEEQYLSHPSYPPASRIRRTDVPEQYNDPTTSSNIPDYEIADTIEVSTAVQSRAYADPPRMTRLDLVLARAATVAELAEAIDRPKSTVAHHVGALVDAA